MAEPKENTTSENAEREEKFFNFRPVFFTAVLLCLGIAFAYLHTVYGVSVWWAFCLLPVAAMAEEAERTLDEQTDQIFRKFKVTGGAVVILKDGERVYERYYGVKNKNAQTPVDENT